MQQQRRRRQVHFRILVILHFGMYYLSSICFASSARAWGHIKKQKASAVGFQIFVGLSSESRHALTCCFDHLYQLLPPNSSSFAGRGYGQRGGRDEEGERGG